VTATHGIGGLTGMLMVGIFAQYHINPAGLTAANGSRMNGLISGDGSLLWHQTLAMAPDPRYGTRPSPFSPSSATSGG
jgi:ammonia channel protein AmtB